MRGCASEPRQHAFRSCRTQTPPGLRLRFLGRRVGLSAVFAWPREMDDETAYMELVKSNAQGKLSALECGMHALHSGILTSRRWGVSSPEERRGFHSG